MIRRAMAAFASALLGAVAPASGQEQEPAPPASSPESTSGEATEEIVVTGSRVKRKDLTTPAPVVVITREQLAQSGYVSVGEYLQALPEQANGMNRNWNNGGDGAMRVSLRGLGDWRTLVLLNGRRIGPGGTGANEAVDLNAIPTAAIERIEVLKDGASPLYGSEAIGGVVNLITRKGWNGSELSAYGGVSSRRDGGTYDATMTAGRFGERGGLLLSAGYTRQDPIWSGDRAFSSATWNLDVTGATNPAGTPGRFAVGNMNGPAGLVDLSGCGSPFCSQLAAAYPGEPLFVPDRSSPLGFRPWRGLALPQFGGDGYNFMADNYLVTPSQRLSLFAIGDLQLGDVARGSLEASFTNRQSRQKLAPEPFYSVNDQVVVSARNRWNPFGADIASVDRRFMEFGNRTFAQDVNALRVLGALDGPVPIAWGPLRGWTWEVSYVYGRTQATEVKSGYARISALRNALGPSFQDADGTWRCGTSPADAVPGCVPLNLFGGPGSITPDQVAGLTYEGTAHGTNEMSSVQATVSGSLFPLFADRPMGVAAGYEYRNVAGTFVPDAVTAARDSATDGSLQTTRGSQDVHEAFAELSVPILSGVPLAESVEAMAAARAFRYRGFGTDWTWKVGGRWTPVRDVTLRGTASTAFRAPDVSELYFGEAASGALLVDALNRTDPCAGVDLRGNPAPVSPWCGPAANNGHPNPFVTLAYHGNADLIPETARVLTVGTVLEPRFARNLSLTVDLYDVQIRRAIVPTQGVLGACYPKDPNVAPLLCDWVQRDPQTQALTQITTTLVNMGAEHMRGIDLAARYTLPTAIGRFGVAADATWLATYDLTMSNGRVIHAKGTYDYPFSPAGYLFPAWKGNAGVSWGWRALGTGLSLRYIGGFTECADATQVFGVSDLGGSTFCSNPHAAERRVSSWTAWNAYATYRFGTAAGTTDVAVGVQNLFDRPPPTVYFTPYPSDPGYDFIGRFFYVRAAQRF